jgi:hypothetical protein
MKLAKIGVLGAMQQEIALLIQNMKNVQERNIGEGKGARTYRHGFLYGSIVRSCSRVRERLLQHPLLQLL